MRNAIRGIAGIFAAENNFPQFKGSGLHVTEGKYLLLLSADQMNSKVPVQNCTAHIVYRMLPTHLFFPVIA